MDVNHILESVHHYIHILQTSAEWLWSHTWKGLLWILLVVVEFGMLLLLVIFRHYEHEIAHQIATQAEGTLIGKISFRLLYYFKVFLIRLGVSIEEHAVVQQWAGLYKVSDLDAALRTAVAQKTGHFTDLFGSRGTRPTHSFIVGEYGNGSKEVIQSLYWELTRDDPSRKIFYFDCSVVPEEDVHFRLLYNLCSWCGVSLSERKQGLSASDPLAVAELGSVFNKGLVRRVLFNKRFLGSRPVVIILDVDSATDRGQTSELYHTSRKVLEALIASKGVDYLLSVNRGSKDEFDDWYRQYWGRRGPVRVGKRIVEHYKGLEKERVNPLLGQRCPRLDHDTKMDDLVALMALMRALPETAVQTFLDEFQDWKGDRVSDRILSRVCEAVTLPDGFDPRRALAILAAAETPLPLGVVYEVLSKCRVPVSGIEKLCLPWKEPAVIEAFIEFGIVQRLEPFDPVFRYPVYSVRPAYKPLCREFLASLGDEGHALNDAIRSVVASMRPPGITPISGYVSRGDFRPLHGLVACSRTGLGGGEELELLLPQAVCEIISATEDGSTLPYCALKTYQWFDRAGHCRTDLVAVLSPSEMDLAGRVCRVQVHIISRAGSGRAVQRALEPFAHTFLDAEGDASRFGPGGYFELLIRLKPIDKMVLDDRIPLRVRNRLEELHRRAATGPMVALVENQVRNSLRSGIDHRATVSLLQCTADSVIEDWIENTKAIEPEFGIERRAPLPYGGSSHYLLRARGRARDRILEHLRSHFLSDDSDTILVECMYSYTAFQVFFVFKRLNMYGRVRAQIAGMEEAGAGHVTLRFMQVAERKMINLSSLRHGPNGTYTVDFELPAGVVAQKDGAAQRLIDELVVELEEDKVKIGFISGLSNFMNENELVLNSAKNDKRFGDGALVDPSSFDYVAEPESFHRTMRKHLFIPDSDAAVIGAVTQARASYPNAQCRVLEIGSATGALSEKLLLSGIEALDTVDPDARLSSFWSRLRSERYPGHLGKHWPMSVEEFANINTEKYDILISQGLHHHIPTSYGEDSNYRLTFMSVCKSLLRPGGIYIISDEFLTSYKSEAERIRNLDRWYRRVIATALAEGQSELADLEYGFWLNDRSKTAEYKESMELFAERLASAGDQAAFEIATTIKFGLTEEYGGGFGVLILRQSDK